MHPENKQLLPGKHLGIVSLEDRVVCPECLLVAWIFIDKHGTESDHVQIVLFGFYKEFFQRIRYDLVIRVQKIDIVPLCICQSLIPDGCSTAVHRILIQADPAVCPGYLPDQLDRPVRGSVIHADDLQVLKGLPLHAQNCGFYVRIYIVYRNDNGYFYVSLKHSLRFFFHHHLIAPFTRCPQKHFCSFATSLPASALQLIFD